MTRDDTERWQAEEALRLSEERFRIVARATNDAVWDWNLLTNEVWWNESVTTLFGYPADEVSKDAVVGQGATWWYQHIHTKDRTRVVSSIYATIINLEQEWTAEYRFERSDGSYADIFDRGFVVYDDQQKPVRMIGSMMDISERKRAERERGELLKCAEAARAEAEKANRVKDEFLALVSHELRTPLTTIKMMTRLAQRDATSETERRECLDSIAIECDRQIDLVLNLLDVSRIEAGALNLQTARVDVAELLDACVKIEQPAATMRGHELLVNVSNENLLHARADRKALRRVLCNLIENAIKYTPDGGRITLSAHLETVSENATIENNVDEIVISVVDTGHGIAPEDLMHIFEKFYRGRASSQAISPNTFEASYAEPEVPGVGLGLYLARSIINQLDGRITVASAIGKGSTFTVHLPAWQDVSESIEENIGASDGEAALSR